MKKSFYFLYVALFFIISCGRTEFDTTIYPDAGTDADVQVLCGNAVVDQGEECDLGEANSNAPGAICRLDCTNAGCGDGILDPDEDCDNGDLNSDESGAACRTTCKYAKCGDGIPDPGEDCDNGDLNSDEPGAACRTDCIAGGCGDGILDPGEDCDDGALNSDEPGATCRTTCKYAGCGDGITDPNLNEECDDGNDIDTDSCTNACKKSKCGDGIVEAGIEICDDGNTYDDITCSADCLRSCGDSIPDPIRGEQCDDGNLSDTEPGACRTDCRFAHCNDSVWDPNQLCFNTPYGLNITGNTVESLVFDFSGDGLKDLLLVSNNSLKIYVNQGLFFEKAWEKSGLISATSPVIADFNNDGKYDLAIVESSQKRIAVFMNISTSSVMDFLTPVRISTGNSGFPSRMTSGDFTGDGVTDLIVTVPYENKMVLMANSGDGSSFIISDISTCERPTQIIKAHFDQNSSDDIAVICYLSGFVGIYKNTGSGLSSPLYVNVQEHPISIRTIDINKDNLDDIIVHKEMTFPVTPEYTIFTAKTDGSFDEYLSGTNLPETSYAVLPGSFDNNPFTDLLIPRTNGFDIYTGDATGTFSLTKSFDWPLNNAKISWNDIDGDNVYDLVIPADNGVFFVLYGKENYPLPSAYSPQTTAIISDIASADFTGDGNADVAVLTSDNIIILTGDGSGHITSSSSVNSSDNLKLLSSDFKNSSEDIVVLSSDGNANVFANDGNGHFSAANSFPASGNNPVSIISHIRINSDVYQDAAVLMSDTSGILIIKGSSSGAVSGGFIAVGSNPVLFANGDINSDGNTDFAVLDGDGVSIYKLTGDGQGAFSVTFAGTLNTPNPSSILLADTNSDGVPELIAGYTDGSIDLYSIESSGNLSFISQLTSSCSISDMFISDHDNDGSKEVLVYCLSTGMMGMMGEVSGTWQMFPSYRATLYPAQKCSVSDLNADGVADTVCLNNDSTFSFYIVTP